MMLSRQLLLLVGACLLHTAIAGRADAACTAGKPEWQCLERVVVLGHPVAPSPKNSDGALIKGGGLCAAFKRCGTPTTTFASRGGGWPGDAPLFPEKVNTFMDQRFASGMDGPRFDQTLDKPFDLTNDVFTVSDDATGDFSGSQCSPLGCPFPGSQPGDPMRDPLQCFGSRFRGFINIRPEHAGPPIHIGVVADNAVSLSIFSVNKDRPQKRPLDEHLLISHALDFNPKLRVTNMITFTEPGLYPIEVDHVNFNAGAILEVVVLFNHTQWRDLDQTLNGQPKLSQLVTGMGPDDDRAVFAFGVLGDAVTLPENFYQTISGAPPYPAPQECRQCPRNFADVEGQTPGNTGCQAGYYCNAAAVCAPCNGDNFCGKSCSPCGGTTPYCVPHPSDPTDAICVQCREDKDCSNGQLCIGHVCTTPNLCCPERPFLIAPDDRTPNIMACSPCREHADCGEGFKCDRLNTRCIATIPQCNTDAQCGRNCVDCKTVEGNRPYCMNGEVCAQCRYDLDCGPGKYCKSGDCMPCIADRKCGAQCRSCGRALGLADDGMSPNVTVTDTPFCYSPDDTVEKAICVRCTKDVDCGEGGTCDRAIHECVNKCADPCPDGQFCDGNRCVQCYTNSQCPCGQCDVSTGTCTAICSNNDDCAGNQCCTLADDGLRKCQPGRCTNTAGGALCGCSITALAPPHSDNDTIHPHGTDLGRSRGILIAFLATLLCTAWLRRRVRLA